VFPKENIKEFLKGKLEKIHEINNKSEEKLPDNLIPIP
jgi:hypothetical protein